VAVFLAKLAEWRSEPPVYYVSSSVTKAGRSEVLKHVEQVLTMRTEG
jgi:hypothetical protein